MLGVLRWPTDYFVEYQYQDTSWMTQTSFVCLMCCVKTFGRQNWRGCHTCLLLNVGTSCQRFQSKLLGPLSGVVSRSVCVEPVPKHFLNNSHSCYISHVMCKNTWQTKLKGAHPFLQSNEPLASGLSEQYFGRSGVVNGPVCEVSVPRHILNDRNIIHMSNVKCANTMQTKLREHSSFYTVLLKIADSDRR